jgi:hypothetical protein
VNRNHPLELSADLALIDRLSERGVGEIGVDLPRRHALAVAVVLIGKRELIAFPAAELPEYRASTRIFCPAPDSPRPMLLGVPPRDSMADEFVAATPRMRLFN